jgi:hypothetical protein
MITKEKNAALNLNIPENLKKEFVNFTYNI